MYDGADHGSRYVAVAVGMHTTHGERRAHAHLPRDVVAQGFQGHPTVEWQRHTSHSAGVRPCNNTCCALVPHGASLRLGLMGLLGGAAFERLGIVLAVTSTNKTPEVVQSTQVAPQPLRVMASQANW